jgi:hypothetical protein
MNKRPKSVSERDRCDNEICDLDENELNQLQKICFKFLPMASLLRETDKNQSMMKDDTKL